MTRRDDWTWEFRPAAARAFEGLDTPIQRHIVSKLEDIVTNEWLDPPEYIEPLSSVPHDEIRIGDFRLEGIRRSRPEGCGDLRHRAPIGCVPTR